MRKAFTLMNLAANLEVTSEIAEINMDNIFEEIKRYNASFRGGYLGEDVCQTSMPTFDILVMELRSKGQKYGRRTKGVLERKREKPGNVGTSKFQPTRTAVPTSRYIKIIYFLFLQNSICLSIKKL